VPTRPSTRYSSTRRRIDVNGRFDIWQVLSARSPHTLKEVRMSELSNSQGVWQPTLVRPTPEREWLTYAEAGEMVGLSRVTLWKLVSAGEVEAARVGRAVRINRESLDAYMRRSAEISTTESR
jgi:excisionase family DNA binding protein